MAKTKNIVVPQGTKLNIELTTDQLVDIARQLRYNVCFCEHEKTKIAGKSSIEIQELLMTLLDKNNVTEAK
tara:strand:+ start:464 stop:676 length:213 start_codon:yes stop_codon:yes gene_type:complete